VVWYFGPEQGLMSVLWSEEGNEDLSTMSRKFRSAIWVPCNVCIMLDSYGRRTFRLTAFNLDHQY
jgi:hypothetical protein